MRFPQLNKDIKLLLLLLAVLTGFASCETEEPGCYQPKTISGRLTFLLRDTTQVDDTVSTDPVATVKRTVYIFADSLMPRPELTLIGEDTALTIVSAGTGKMIFAFNERKDSVRYTLRIDSTSTVYDTLTFYYEPVLHFISNNCGYNYYYNIKGASHTTNMLDSFSISVPEATEATAANVLFYFKPKF